MNPICKQCGKVEVEDSRVCYATPVCFACLPPPPPLRVSVPSSWLADAAEALGEVRPEDGAPKALNWNQVLDAIRDMREERDEWKLRAEQSEYHHECCRKRSHP